jgi:uncharacterized alpha/beta hydrolase family protein
MLWKIILIIILVISAIVILIAIKNNRRTTKTDRKLDRKAREAERAEIDKLYEMKLRNEQMQKYRK